MLKKTSDSTEITPLVNSAVEKLQELGHCIRTRKYDVDQVDTSGVDVVIKALRDLEAERQKLHELLETETITASVLRYKLQYLPSDIKYEIQGAVHSARQSNEAEIKRLKTQLNTIIKNIESLEKRHHDLAEENAKLEPERNEMQIGHDEIIALLNQKMADKASKQITLNETRDKLRETYKKVSEKLTLRRKLRNRERQILKKGRRLTNYRKSWLTVNQFWIQRGRKFETSRNRLEAQEVQLNRHLQKEIRDNSNLTQEGMKIVKEHNEMTTALDEKKKSLMEQLDMVKAKLKEAEEQHRQLNFEKESQQKELDIALEIKEQDRDVVRHHERKLAKAKESLQLQNAECSRIRSENIELEEEFNQLEEINKATVDVLNKEIEASKAALTSERKDRQVLQTKRDHVSKEYNEFKADYGRYMATQSKRVTEGKAEHSRLTEKGTRLQEDLKKDERDMMSKQELLKAAKQDYTTLQKQLKTRLKTLQQSIEKLEKEKEGKNNLIDDKTPIFEDLEAQFKERSQEFDITKKNIVDLKNKKAGLETSVQRAQRDVEKLAEPQTRLHCKLREKRVEALEQLKSQSEEVKKH
ncbi:PREDICTED: intracellular protein transport protein USO1-like [Acropora digitifera]|uniref:intracellular protein transport protein USO1-like n=1 Tax=Acropora digitifera TaxID=70779 RepID=UPI000779F860|nr:PREDICTED: intracellular protein transport protein USO1-like [Acropora digitifera]